MHIKIIILSVVIVLVGCLARPVVLKPYNKEHLVQNRKIAQAVSDKAKTGDWLVIRGYHTTDNLVANATNIPISHVGVFDFESQMVIEAEGKGVHTSTLSEFIDKSYRLLIIRPRWRNDANARLAVDNAHKLVGKNYDFLGTVGFNFPSKYYCSELAVLIYKQWHSAKEKFPKVIKPGELYLYGKVLYDSLPRDEI